MVDAWRDGDRKRAVERAPEELVREIFVFGRPRRACASGSSEFAAGGITTLCLMPICAARAAARADRRARAGMSDS